MLRQRRRLVLAVVPAFVVGLLWVACHQRSERIRLSGADNGQIVAIAVGQQFDIALEVPVGPAYYGDPVISSQSVRFLGEFDEVAGPPVNPGGGKTQRYEFEAVAVGQARITIERPPPGTSPPQAFQITVHVY